jgi:hypothetical protein
MAKKAATENGVVELPVRYGNVSIGEDTVRLGIRISRGNLTPGKADALLCGRRLTCQLSCVPRGKDVDEPTLPGVDVGRQVEAVVDVNAVSMTRKNIGAGLTRSLADVDLDSLVHFAKRDGRLTITKVEDLDDKGGDEDADE